ncbi:MAG: GAF domain-containing protein [bacterium]
MKPQRTENFGERKEDIAQESQSNVVTKAIYDISRVIVGRFQIEDLLNETVTTLAQLLHADACSVFLIDEDGKLRIKAGVGYSANLMKISAEYELGKGVTGSIASKSQTYRTTMQEIHNDHPDWKGVYDRIQWPDGKGRCISFLGVPLKVKNKVIGVLKVENKRERNGEFADAFTKEDEELLEILANIIAMAIENATLITAEEKQRDRIVNLYRIGSMLQEQDDINRLLYIFLTGLTHDKVLGFNRAMYFEYQPITKRLIGRMAIGPFNKEEGKPLVGSFTIEAHIHVFDEGRKALNTDLNRLISDIVIDLEKGDICLEWAAKGENIFREYDISSFSTKLKVLLEKIEAKNVILIGIAPSKEKYNFIFCDNIYDQKSFEQATKDLLPVFISQMSKALERVQVTEEVKSAKESAWQEVSAMTAHRLGNILPFTENRFDDALKIPIDNIKLQRLLKSCHEDMKVAINVLSDFKKFATAGRINLTCIDDVNNTMKQIETLLKTDFKDVEIQTIYLKQEIIPRIRMDFEAIKIVFHNFVTNTKEAQPKSPEIKIWAGASSDSELNRCGLRPKGNFIKIVYEDNGPGIPDDEKEKIFEPFVTHKTGNSGL